jgi:hypothetical protein
VGCRLSWRYLVRDVLLAAVWRILECGVAVAFARRVPGDSSPPRDPGLQKLI